VQAVVKEGVGGGSVFHERAGKSCRLQRDTDPQYFERKTVFVITE
jgi:hypothetical protein